MTENKRFRLREPTVDDTIGCSEISDNGEWITYGEIVELLNKFNDECEFLEIENEALEDGAIRYAELYHQSLKENEQLKQSIDMMGGRLQGLWAHYYANRWSIWSEVAEDIANELGFKIHHAYDDPIPNSESKKERVEGVKKITEILRENEQLKCGNKNLKATLNDFINICNRLQANPTDEQTLNVARYMLQNMGVELE